jgi:hypothetical protein
VSQRPKFVADEAFETTLYGLQTALSDVKWVNVLRLLQNERTVVTAAGGPRLDLLLCTATEADLLTGNRSQRGQRELRSTTLRSR